MGHLRGQLCYAHVGKNKIMSLVSRTDASPGNASQVGPVIDWPFFQSLLHLCLCISCSQDKPWFESFVVTSPYSSTGSPAAIQVFASSVLSALSWRTYHAFIFQVWVTSFIMIYFNSIHLTGKYKMSFFFFGKSRIVFYFVNGQHFLY